MPQLKPWNLLSQLIFGSMGAAIGAAAGWFGTMNYGGNFGCPSFVDAIFDSRGYESCGAFGGWIGLFFGLLIGVWLAHKTTIRDPEALSRFKRIFIPLGILAIPLAFGLIYFQNSREHAQRMAVLEKGVERRMIESNLIDWSLPVEVANLAQAPERLEALFAQGADRLTVRLITGASAEKWALEAENSNPPSENLNAITALYPNERAPHLALTTHFDYEKPSALSGPESAEKNALLAIEGLRILQKDPRLLEDFAPKAEELRTSLMVAVRDGFLKGPPTSGK